jgi:hypothetical protein
LKISCCGVELKHDVLHVCNAVDFALQLGRVFFEVVSGGLVIVVSCSEMCSEYSEIVRGGLVVVYTISLASRQVSSQSLYIFLYSACQPGTFQRGLSL